MKTIAQHPSTVEYLETLRQALQRDTALRQAACQARTRYAGEAKRIGKGLVIALNGGVTIATNGTATVQSASDPEVVYHVSTDVCDCPDFERAPDGRCKHRYAVCLVKRAQKALAHRFFASYTAPDGTVHGGIVTRTPSGWLFCPEDGGDLLYAAAQALALGETCY